MIKSAWDLDGVFIPDLDFIEYNDKIFIDIWGKLRPTFVPNYPINIVTMRNNAVKDFTIKWLKLHGFQIESITFLGDGVEDFTPEISAKRKASFLISDGIIRYIESDLKIVNFMKQYLDFCVADYEVIHFDDLIKGAINE